MSPGDMNDWLTLFGSLGGIAVFWWTLGRKWWNKWREPIRQEREGLRAMVAEYPEQRAKHDEMRDSVGRLTGQTRVISQTLDGHSKVLGTLQARSQAQYEASSIAEFECDATGYNTSVNEKYAESLGVDKSELLGYRWRTHIPHDFLPGYLERVQSAVDDHRKHAEEVPMNHKSGRQVTFRVGLIPFPPDAGPATHLTGTLTPVATE